MTFDHDGLFAPNKTKAAATYDSRFAVLGTGFMNMAAFGDGINVMCLMGSNNLLPGYASFSETVEEVRAETEKLLKQCTSGEVSMYTPFFFMDAEKGIFRQMP